MLSRTKRMECYGRYLNKCIWVILKAIITELRIHSLFLKLELDSIKQPKSGMYLKTISMQNFI